MAKLKTIYMSDTASALKLNIGLRPSGEVWIDVPLPEDFYDCIMKIAQRAADAKEQEMRAQILADAAMDES